MAGQKSVPAAELEVVAFLRKLGPVTAREVRESLHSYRPMTHGSVMNLLKRLQAKGLVTRKKGPVGKAFVCQSTQAVHSVVHTTLGRLVNRIFAGTAWPWFLPCSKPGLRILNRLPGWNSFWMS